MLMMAGWLVAGCSGDPAAKPGFHEINQHRFFVNSLGMQFVQLPGSDAWLGVWETRVADYAAFANASTNGWQAAWFQDTDHHPAVNVQWDDAQAFCAWLSQRERESGLLTTNEGYRLPTTSEWTLALGQAETPEISNFGLQLGIDSFPQTSPVGSFPGNTLGLHDLRGNVWECAPLGQTRKVLAASCAAAAGATKPPTCSPPTASLSLRQRHPPRITASAASSSSNVP